MCLLTLLFLSLWPSLLGSRAGCFLLCRTMFCHFKTGGYLRFHHQFIILGRTFGNPLMELIHRNSARHSIDSMCSLAHFLCDLNIKWPRTKVKLGLNLSMVLFSLTVNFVFQNIDTPLGLGHVLGGGGIE